MSEIHEGEIINTRHKTKQKTGSFILPLLLMVWPWLMLPVIFILFTLSGRGSFPEFFHIIINILIFIALCVTIVGSLPSFVIGVVLLFLQTQKRR